MAISLIACARAIDPDAPKPEVIKRISRYAKVAIDSGNIGVSSNTQFGGNNVE